MTDPKKPRVIFLGALPPPYMGPTLATQVILDSSLAREFELIHLDTSDHREIDTLGAIDFTNIWLALKGYFQLLVMILRYWPDMVYVPISQTTIGYLKDSGFIVISKLFGRKVLCHLRGGNFKNWIDGASSLTRAYVKFVHSLVDGQIVLGESLKGLFADFVPAERIHVVPNGKDIDFDAPEGNGGPVRLLFLANIVRTKGVLDVLHSVDKIVAECPDVEFVFCGAWEDAELRTEIEAFLTLHPSLPILWMGPVKGERKAEAIRSADIFVFPTYYPPEGHPWVVIEAMAAGLPVISTDQGAITESVQDGRNGFIVEKMNPDAVADKSITLIRDSGLRRRMGKESRALYEQRFTEASMVANMSKAFNVTLGIGRIIAAA